MVFRIKIEADLQEERAVTVIEQAIQTFKPQAKPAKVQESAARSPRGRGARGASNRRGRGQTQSAMNGRDAPAHPHTHSETDSSALNMSELKSVLPEVHPVPPPPLKNRLKLQYLLPIELLATLPHSYPLHSAPLVRLSSPWLSPNLKRSLLARIEPRKAITSIA